MAPGKSVLIVDDERANRLLLQTMLERAGYRAIVAESGDEALRRVETESFSLVLVDYMMPGLDGVTLTAKLRKNPATRTVPIMILTAALGEEAEETALLAGANDFLQKPFDRPSLLSRIEALV